MNKVSILMPVFNEQDFIKEAIESVLSQTHNNFELIIVDDFSSDETYSIAKKYSLKDSRIDLIKNSEKGKVSAFNLAFKKSTGDYICFFAGDDIMDKESIHNRLSPILSSDYKFIASTSKVKTISKMIRFNNVIIPKNKKKGTFVGGAVMLNVNLARKVFPIPKELPNEDRWTELHIRFFSNIHHTSKISLLYRIHLKNSSSRTDDFNNKNMDMHKRFAVFKLFLNKYQKNLSEPDIFFLKKMSKAEQFRYNNQTWKLLFFTGLPFRDKIRFIFHSNKILYSIRINFFSLFSGWGN